MDAIRLGSYGVSGMIGGDMLTYALIALPASLAGAYSGRFVEMRINEKVFRSMVALLLMATGILLAAGT